MTQSSPRFTAAQVLEAGQRAESDGRPDYALQFYRYLTEHYANSHESMIAWEALNRLAPPQLAVQPATLPARQPFARPQLPSSVGFGVGANEIAPEANGQVRTYPQMATPGNGAADPYAPGIQMPSMEQMPSMVRRRERTIAAPSNPVMPRAQDRYRVGGIIASALSIVGWMVVTAGIIVAVLGLGIIPRSGAIIGFGPSLIYCMGGLVLGLALVLASKIARAVFDSANATRDLVAIEQARARQPRSDPG